METDVPSVEQLIDALIDREGGYVSHRVDRGGPTCWGITEAVDAQTAIGIANGMNAYLRGIPEELYALHWHRLSGLYRGADLGKVKGVEE